MGSDPYIRYMIVSEDRVRRLPVSTPEQRAAQEWVQGRLRWERWLRELERPEEPVAEAAEDDAA